MLLSFDTYEGQHSTAVVAGPSEMQLGLGPALTQDVNVAAAVQSQGQRAGLSRRYEHTALNRNDWLSSVAYSSI